MDTKNHEPSAAAKELQRYLKEHDLSIQRFCSQHGIDRIQVQRIINGTAGARPSADFARAIHLATHGEVPWYAWTKEGTAPDAVRWPATTSEGPDLHPRPAKVGT